MAHKHHAGGAHDGMKHHSPVHKGRADHHASHHGHHAFGKSGGGHGGLHTELISSPMSKKMPGLTHAHKHAK